MTLDYPPPPARKRSRAPVVVETTERPVLRREMDVLLMDAWQKRFDELSGQVAELARTVRGFNGTPGLTQEMERVKYLMQDVAPKVNELYQWLIAERALAAAGVKKEAPATTDETEKPLTRGKLAMILLELSKPIVTAVVIWLLLTFFPALFGHLGP